MKFIHTADWHLGRLFHGSHLTEDQRHVLMQFVDLVRFERPDAVLVAGDIYDRAVPPPEAVDLLDEVLSKLVVDLNVPVLLIAGNHDSPNRLDFGSRLFAEQRLHVRGTLPKTLTPIVLHDDAGPVFIYAVPYVEPAVVRNFLSDPEVIDHDSALRKLSARLRSAEPAGRRILMTHAYVAGGIPSESERPLSVGDAGTVDGACFDGFAYVALGHLHHPQRVAGGAARYSGSLLKYSFDEADKSKSVSIVEMDASGHCVVKKVGLSPRHEVRRLRGTIRELLERPVIEGSVDDYLEITLTDDGPVLDAAGRLRKVYPNVMCIVRPPLDAARMAGDPPNIRGRSERELFRSFFLDVTANELNPIQERAFITVADRIGSEPQEGGI